MKQTGKFMETIVCLLHESWWQVWPSWLSSVTCCSRPDTKGTYWMYTVFKFLVTLSQRKHAEVLITEHEEKKSPQELIDKPLLEWSKNDFSGEYVVLVKMGRTVLIPLFWWSYVRIPLLQICKWSTRCQFWRHWHWDKVHMAWHARH